MAGITYHAVYFKIKMLKFIEYPFKKKLFPTAGAVTFSIGGEAESPQPSDTNLANEPGAWNCVWKCRTATPVHLMSFSPDGTLFATTGMNDRLVKIWFENKQCEYFSVY